MITAANDNRKFAGTRCRPTWDVWGTYLLLAAVVVAGGLWASGCSRDDKTTSGKEPACPSGTLQCPCNLDGTCNNDAPSSEADGGGDSEGTGERGQELICREGYCVPETHCIRGSEGCVCYPNGTCNTAAGGAVLICNQDDICQLPDDEKPDVPGAGEPCEEEVGCGELNSTPLSCLDGICRFAPGTCAPGDAWCQCTEGEVCGDGLVCAGDYCHPAPAEDHGLVVTGGDRSGARACDVRLSVAQSRTASIKVTFPQGVVGEWRGKKDYLALAFTVEADSALPVKVASLAVGVPKDIRDDSILTVEKVQCYDRQGRPITDIIMAVNK